MSISKENKNIVSKLRASLNARETQEDLDQKKITPCQARNIFQWIVAVKHIRETPTSTYPVQAESGVFIGEITKSGEAWIARYYGNEYPNDVVEFSSEDEANAFLRSKI